MIYMFRKVRLFTSALFQKSLGTFRPLSLKLRTKPVASSTKVSGVRTREVLSVARGCNIDNSDVHAEPFERLTLLGVGHIHGHEEVELALSENKICLAAIKQEQLPLVVATNEGDTLPSFYCPNTHGLAFPGQDAGIVRDRAEGSKRPLCFPVQFVGVGHLCDGANDDLGRKVGKRGSTLGVGSLVQRKLSPCFRHPSLLGKPVACGVGVPKSLLQHHYLFGDWQELDLYDQLHRFKYGHGFETCNKKREGLLPALNGGVSASEK